MRTVTFLSSLLWAVALGTGEPARAETDSSTNTVVMAFSVPPFAEEETAAGVDGWKLISSGKPELAIVRTHGDSQPGLLLRTYGIEKILTDRMAGQVTVTAVVQFGVVSAKGSRTALTFMPMVNVGVGSAPFGFDNGDPSSPEPGGFFYVEKSPGENDTTVLKRVNLLPREAAFEGAKYTLTANLDLVERTYVLSIAGTGQDGQPVKVQSKKILMGVPDRPAVGEQFLTGIRLASSLPASTELFVESITIAPSAP